MAEVRWSRFTIRMQMDKYEATLLSRILDKVVLDDEIPLEKPDVFTIENIIAELNIAVRLDETYWREYDSDEGEKANGRT